MKMLNTRTQNRGLGFLHMYALKCIFNNVEWFHFIKSCQSISFLLFDFNPVLKHALDGILSFIIIQVVSHSLQHCSHLLQSLLSIHSTCLINVFSLSQKDSLHWCLPSHFMKGLDQVPDLTNVGEVTYLIDGFDLLGWVPVGISAVIYIQLIHVSQWIPMIWKWDWTYHVLM